MIINELNKNAAGAAFCLEGVADKFYNISPA